MSISFVISMFAMQYIHIDIDSLLTYITLHTSHHFITKVSCVNTGLHLCVLKLTYPYTISPINSVSTVDCVIH